MNMNNISIQKQDIFKKIATIIALILIFILLMYIGTSIILYFNSPEKNPYIIKGLVRGTKQKTILQDPNKKDSKTILRSTNEDSGLEFTWSIWLYIDSPSVSSDNLIGFKHIFHKGNDSKRSSDIGNKGIFMPNNAPGLYLKYDSNTPSYEPNDKTLSLYGFFSGELK